MQDSNLRPIDEKSTALPTELTTHSGADFEDFYSVPPESGGSCRMTRLRLALRAVAKATLSFTFNI